MCLYPKLIKNRKYTANKKNGGNIPPLRDERVELVAVGCQNCIECRQQKARNWQVRLLEDIKTNRNGKFVTLTFSNESYAEIAEKYPNLEGYVLDNAVATYAVRHWLERWRKLTGKSIRHWLVTELGQEGTENIHLHGIIWTDADLDEVEKVWEYGFMWKYKIERGRKVNYVNATTVTYITKYVTKQDELHKTYKPIILTSKGIGGNYTQRMDSRHNKYTPGQTNETYRTSTGHKMAMPIYWRNKIYTDEQREALWIEKLDKDVRYIRGEKYDMKRDSAGYFKSLKWHRKLNRELGYGDDEKNWDLEQYERQLRLTKQRERIENNNNKKKT